MDFFTFLLILVIIAGILGIIYVINYNKMQYLKTKIEQSEGIIDETLRERYDLLVRADGIIKTALNDDKDYMKEYINLKNKNLTNFEMDRSLRKAFIVLSKFKDDYKELQNNKEMKEIFISIKESNEKLTATTSYYNKNTNMLNGYIRKFPSNLIAKFNNFKIKPFFDGKDMTDEIYDDFKL